jgi:hypothetical protein
VLSPELPARVLSPVAGGAEQLYPGEGFSLGGLGAAPTAASALVIVTGAASAELAQGLVDRGHEVTLIGAGRALTPAAFLATYSVPRSDRLGEPLPEVIHAARAARLLEDRQVDIVHDHSLAGPLLAGGRTVPTVLTAHGPAVGEVGAYYRALGVSVGLVAISDAQRRAAPDLPWVATVHNAVAVDQYPYLADKDDTCSSSAA